MSFKYKWDINEYDFSASSVSFTAEDKALQGVLEDCEALCKENKKTFADGTDFSIAYEDKKIEKRLLANDCIKEF